MNDDYATPDQHRWADIAKQLREQLADRIPEIVAMTPAECGQFVDAVTSARWLEVNAALHDKQIEDSLKKLYCDP